MPETDRPAGRKRLSKNERRRVYEKTGGRCAYCGCALQIEEMAVDHVIPLADGGADAESNLLPACRSCNHRKNTESVERFRASVERFPVVLARDSVTYRNAVRFGLVVPNPHNIKFYFELIKEGNPT
jgi:hypothetical protein